MRHATRLWFSIGLILALLPAAPLAASAQDRPAVPSLGDLSKLLSDFKRVPLAPDQIVDRLMAFDKNEDGKITADEVPERMMHLFAKSDLGKDGALDKEGILKLAETLAKTPAGKATNGADFLAWYLEVIEQGLSRNRGPKTLDHLGGLSLGDLGERIGDFRRAPLAPEKIVDRLMAFDKNEDGKITTDEVPERMMHLFAKSDLVKDGALDKEGILKLAASLAKTPAARATNGADFGAWYREVIQQQLSRTRGGAKFERDR